MSRLPYSANRVKGNVDFMVILVYVRYLNGIYGYSELHP